MTVDEFIDYAKTHFSDRSFVDRLTRFCAESWPEDEEAIKELVETKLPINISLEKLAFLMEVMKDMPLIISKDKNVSKDMLRVMYEQPRQ